MLRGMQQKLIISFLAAKYFPMIEVVEVSKNKMYYSKLRNEMYEKLHNVIVDF